MACNTGGCRGERHAVAARRRAAGQPRCGSGRAARGIPCAAVEAMGGFRAALEARCIQLEQAVVENLELLKVSRRLQGWSWWVIRACREMRACAVGDQSGALRLGFACQRHFESAPDEGHARLARLPGHGMWTDGFSELVRKRRVQTIAVPPTRRGKCRCLRSWSGRLCATRSSRPAWARRRGAVWNPATRTMVQAAAGRCWGYPLFSSRKPMVLLWAASSPCGRNGRNGRGEPCHSLAVVSLHLCRGKVRA